MIFKVFYQETKVRNPKREHTHSLYIEAKDAVEARFQIEQNTQYNIEYIELLEGNHLKYEQEHANFKLTEFNND